MQTPSPTRITQAHIDGIISRAKVEVSKLGEKTCLVHVTLKNGFEMTEVAACVDPVNYDEAIGKAIALKRVVDRLWQLEGWALACSEFGRP